MTASQPRLLDIGELAPWFRAPVHGGRADWTFSSAAGSTVLMLFMGSAAAPQVAAALAEVMARADLFDDERVSFFSITADPTDAENGRIAQRLPGIRHFLDYSRQVSALYGAGDAASSSYRPHFLLLDRTLQVAGRYALADVRQALHDADMLAADAGQDWAPVLTVPRLFEPELCAELMALYDRDGGTESGFMREVDGKTALVTDAAFKRRRDASIEDERLVRAIADRVRRKLVPAVQRSFQFKPTRIERYIVAAYDAGAGHFAPHRDNTTKGTAHRRFAVTINLNADYDGGNLRFPEFGSRTYRAPVGGAVVFSCSLLHEATPVTRGRRYACLPFLYDDEGARIREQNNAFLAEGVSRYPGTTGAEAA